MRKSLPFQLWRLSMTGILIDTFSTIKSEKFSVKLSKEVITIHSKGSKWSSFNLNLSSPQTFKTSSDNAYFFTIYVFNVHLESNNPIWRNNTNKFLSTCMTITYMPQLSLSLVSCHGVILRSSHCSALHRERLRDCIMWRFFLCVCLVYWDYLPHHSSVRWNLKR